MQTINNLSCLWIARTIILMTTTTIHEMSVGHEKSQEAQCEAVNLWRDHPTLTLAPYIIQQPTFFWSETS
jgi:hypothetical protein